MLRPGTNSSRKRSLTLNPWSSSSTRSKGDEKDEVRGVVELRGGKGAGLRATQRQNDLDSRLLNTSKLIKVTILYNGQNELPTFKMLYKCRF